MPIILTIPPTISQVYGAFDESSHRVFRYAMSKSCGGVLRAKDLLVALSELERASVADVLPEDWRFDESIRAVAEHSRLAPMSNEPALRRWLFEAYEVALEQPDDLRAVITPRVLWVVACALRLVPNSRSIAAICERLGVECSPRLVALHRPPSATATVAVDANEGVAGDVAGRELEQIVNAWLALQSLPAGVERTTARARLAEGARRLEAMAG